MATNVIPEVEVLGVLNRPVFGIQFRDPAGIVVVFLLTALERLAVSSTLNAKRKRAQQSIPAVVPSWE